MKKIFEEDIDPVAYVEEHGLKTVSDTGMLEEAARRVIALQTQTPWSSITRARKRSWDS